MRKSNSPLSKPVNAHQFTAPAYWASYLINGDDSGIDYEAKKQADAFIKRIGMGSPVSCEEAGIIRHHDAFWECPMMAECQTYTFLSDL